MMRKCPCCKNPWQQSAECFALSCDACLTDESAKGLDPANMDTSVSPAVDFFAHANGGWQKANPIPAEYPAWNTFISLHDQNLGRLRDLLEQLPPPPPDDGACEEVILGAFGGRDSNVSKTQRISLVSLN